MSIHKCEACLSDAGVMVNRDGEYHHYCLLHAPSPPDVPALFASGYRAAMLDLTHILKERQGAYTSSECADKNALPGAGQGIDDALVVINILLSKIENAEVSA